MNKERFKAWLDGDLDVMDSVLDLDETSDDSRDKQKEALKKLRRRIDHSREARRVAKAETKGIYIL